MPKANITQKRLVETSRFLWGTYRDNHLTKRKTKNNGELPKYHVENCHEPIIDIGAYNSVQTEMKKRSEKFTVSEPKKTYPFTGLITCTVCGKHYRRKLQGESLWQCNAKFKGDKKCTTLHLYEDEIKALFVKALSKLLVDRNALFEDGILIRKTLMDMTEIDVECDELLGEMDVTAMLMQKCIDENAAKIIHQEEYASKFSALTEKHEKQKSRYDSLQKQCERRLWQADILGGFLFAIKELDMLQLDFNPTLWHTTVDHVTVYADERLVFKFRNGSEVEVRR